MNSEFRKRREPAPEGGARPVPEIPPDQPRRLRGPILFLTLIVGALLLITPIAWAFISFVAVGAELSTATQVVFWVVWAICLIAFIWIVTALWRRAA